MDELKEVSYRCVADPTHPTWSGIEGEIPSVCPECGEEGELVPVEATEPVEESEAAEVAEEAAESAAGEAEEVAPHDNGGDVVAESDNTNEVE